MSGSASNEEPGAGGAPLFAFGTLMDEEVLAIVCDRPIATFATEPARVSGRARRAVTDDHYPVLVEAPGASVEGLLIHGLDAAALERIAFFEGEEFTLEPIRVTRAAEGATRSSGRASGPLELDAVHFAHTDRKPVGESGWELADWQANTKPDTLPRVRRYMAHFGVLSVAEADAHW